MDLQIVFRAGGAFPPDDDSRAAFIENLRDTGQELVALERQIKRDSHKTGRNVCLTSRESPRHSAGLVVKRSEEIPGTRSGVLKLPSLALFVDFLALVFVIPR